MFNLSKFNPYAKILPVGGLYGSIEYFIPNLDDKSLLVKALSGPQVA